MPPDWRLLAVSVKKQERVETIIRRLNEQYPETPIPLDHSDAFTLLIAVLLSAQCTDKKVNEVTPALFAAGPNPAAMAALSEAEILGLIRQLGLAKTKAKNVKRLAELLLLQLVLVLLLEQVLVQLFVQVLVLYLPEHSD